MVHVLNLFCISFLLVFTFPEIIYAQKLPKHPGFIAVIEDKSENFVLSGALYRLTDSSVVITCSNCKTEEMANFQINVSYAMIDKIIIKKNVRVNHWYIAGAFSGLGTAVFSVIYALQNGKEFFYPHPISLTFNAALGFLPFFLAGTMLNTFWVKSKIPINKNFVLFSKSSETLRNYCFIR